MTSPTIFEMKAMKGGRKAVRSETVARISLRLCILILLM